MKLDNSKQLIIEQLRKTPIIEIACRNSGVGRSTYYRWRGKSDKFKKIADEAIEESRLLTNDIAESQLIKLVKEGHFNAINYWLSHNHPIYSNRMEVLTKEAREKLTPTEINLLEKAIGSTSAASPIPSLNEKINEENKQNENL